MVSTMKLLVQLFVILCVLYSATSLKILGVFPIPAYSHYAIHLSVLKGLAARGHEVTVINPYPQKNQIKNFKDISVETHINFFSRSKKQLYDLDEKFLIQKIHFFTNAGYTLTEETLKHVKVQELLKSNESFDLVLVSLFINEGLLGIAHHFNAPVVLISTMPLYAWCSFVVGHPGLPSHTPNLLSSFSHEMNFWQRAVNTFYESYAILYYQLFMLPKHRALVRKYIPGGPDLYTFLNNASLSLLNTDASVYDAAPYPPNAFPIGGVHVQPQPLSHELEMYLNESTNGVLVFSMGSILKAADISPNKLQAMVSVFAKLKENVLFKLELDHLPDQPKNVKIVKWLPQQDVLAHPNVRALVSHGGLLSTIEAVYYGKPLVGIPIFADQKMNIASAVRIGYAIKLEFSEIDEKQFGDAVDRILHDPSYRKVVKERSRIMHDQPLTPLERAIFWVEYVGRHGNAKHLRYSGMNLAWYERYLLDVIAFYLLVIISFVYLIVQSAKRVCKVKKDKTE